MDRNAAAARLDCATMNENAHTSRGSSRRRIARLALVLFSLAPAAGGAIPDARAASGNPIPPPDNGGAYWGALIGTHFTGAEPPSDWKAIPAFEARNTAGKRMSVVHWGRRFSADYCGPQRWCSFPRREFRAVAARGIIPFYSWSPNPYRSFEILAGQADAYLRRWAAAAAAYGRPFFLRFAWEMNGTWFPWGISRAGQTAAEFRAMWRHVHDIFEDAGARNVAWVWCPNRDYPQAPATIADVYPGDANVDWTCIDGYNYNDPWRSFSELYAETYEQVLAVAPGKPMVIGEVASTEQGGSKAQWIRDMFRSLDSRFSRVRGLLWFNRYERGFGSPLEDFPVDTSATSSAAFAAGIARNQYVTPATSGGELDLTATTKAGRTLETRYGQRVTVQGRLRDRRGRPIRNAALRVNTVAAVPGARLVRDDNVRTGRDGRFRYRTHARTSGKLRVWYRFSTASVRLVVRGSGTFAVRPRRERRIRTLTFSGRVQGGFVPRDGLLVDIRQLERRRGKDRWRVVRTVRTTSSRFKTRYTLPAKRGKATYRFSALVRGHVAWPFKPGRIGRTQRVTMRP